ncbi:glycerophosphodiester phosphodiesterase 1 isoform X1 [Leptidea sinapis]|uniref:glycerophosphodiester phosphodiesterase 1 isoform X1 n=1 Tax=Leptidea sinapis TaxID=189913 RepID=UPI0021C3EB97|nr:glycerophosphodiester phosphodiesterase 1 isoform X1 [Leptidea sinapis]XP_050676611.1 glycerophosphodiester phosphodiesterase 1 isoform X1 [Leptidea sinapis]XP_050676612.1 glycerophosphodiester phosphodiesterase 1 isoform X1 [Leptidea sinapis]
MILTVLSVLYSGLYYLCLFLINLLTVLPLGIDVGLFGVAAYFTTKLKRPDPENVSHIFGPEHGSKEGDSHPERILKCIAHRGAGLDAPENTLEAFKYCVERDCNFVELDVRTSKDGQLVLLHDRGLERLTGANISNVQAMDWESLKSFDVGAKHPNREHFRDVRLCLLEEAIDYLLANKVKMIIDIKGEDKQMVNGIVQTFASNPVLYKYAVVTSFNPFMLYQIRKRDPEIVGALSYRPYCFSAADYDAENGPTNPRFGDKLPIHVAVRVADFIHSLLWRWTARWCSVSAVLLHKDIVSPSEVYYWRSLGIRCAGWCVNRPVEKLYWRSVLKSPYLANTLVGEPEMDDQKDYQKKVKEME